MPATCSRRHESQCECGLPVPHIPQDLGTPEQDGADSPATLEAKVENFLASLFDPQCGQGVPSQRLERTSTSLSFSQLSQ